MMGSRTRLAWTLDGDITCILVLLWRDWQAEYLTAIDEFAAWVCAKSVLKAAVGDVTNSKPYWGFVTQEIGACVRGEVILQAALGKFSDPKADWSSVAQEVANWVAGQGKLEASLWDMADSESDEVIALAIIAHNPEAVVLVASDIWRSFNYASQPLDSDGMAKGDLRAGRHNSTVNQNRVSGTVES